jgi:hypothetical protein
MGILMGDDGGSFRIQPCVAIRVIEVPVRVDQVFDRIAAETVGSLQDARARCGDPGIDEHLAVVAGQDSDIATRAFKNY